MQSKLETSPKPIKFVAHHDFNLSPANWANTAEGQRDRVPSYRGSEAYKRLLAAIIEDPPSENDLLERLREALPKPFRPIYRPIIKGAMRRGETDRIYGSKLLLCRFQLQGLANIIQFLFVLFCFVFLLSALH